MQNETNGGRYKSYKFKVTAVVEVDSEWQAENEEEAIEIAKRRVDMGFLEDVELTNLSGSNRSSKGDASFLEALKRDNEATRALREKQKIENEKRRNRRKQGL